VSLVSKIFRVFTQGDGEEKSSMYLEKTVVKLTRAPWRENPQLLCRIYGAEHTWDFFVDAVKEQYYPIGNYEDQYMRWTKLRQERGQSILEFTNSFHTLCTKLGIKDSERNLVLKYRGDLHRYIQTEMDFLDISSLGAAYQYVVKIE
jgi:hypothetical protein